MNSSLFWLPKTSTVWLDPIGFILFIFAWADLVYNSLPFKIGKKRRNCSGWWAYVTNCLNLVDIWCD
jgi:hypothetical protein